MVTSFEPKWFECLDVCMWWKSKVVQKSHTNGLWKACYVQHRDTLKYATIHGGKYYPQVWCYNPRDCLYLKQTTHHDVRCYNKMCNL